MTSFTEYSWKVIKRAMIIARGCIKGTIYVIKKRSYSIGVADLNVDEGL